MQTGKCGFYVEIDGKQQHPALLSPWLGFNKSPTEHSRIIGYRIIGYEHNLLSNGGYPLSLNPSKVPATQYQPKPLVTPLSTCPHRDCGGPILQQQSLSIGGDTVWPVYHCTSNT